MTVSFKDGAKLAGIAVMCACAAFVCSFFLNFYIDASAIAGDVPQDCMAIYDAQLAMAKVTCAVSGGCLLLVSAVLLAFYVKLYIDRNAKQLGILKAMGYPDGKIAAGFGTFGLSALIGTSAGYLCSFLVMPTVYSQMSIGGLPEIAIRFHAVLPLCLVLAPALLFSALAVLFAWLKLRRPVGELLREKPDKTKKRRGAKDRSARPFLKELRRETLKYKKSLAFFVAFASFCFSCMLQMSASMKTLSSETMGYMIFGIGIVLAATSLLLAATSLVNANAKTVSVMKAYGYTVRECREAIFGGYRFPAAIGFMIGTAYQYGLLKTVVELIFRDVATMPEYRFDVGIFFAVLALFIPAYELTMYAFSRKICRLTVRAVMTE